MILNIQRRSGGCSSYTTSSDCKHIRTYKHLQLDTNTRAIHVPMATVPVGWDPRYESHMISEIQDYEQSLFFLLSSSSCGKGIVKAGVRKLGREKTRTILSPSSLVFPRPSFRVPAFAMSFPRLDELKRKNRDCS